MVLGHASSETEAAIRVVGLRKSYGDVEAVRGVDLEVWRGEIFALLGPNGAGKTTTVEILEGFRRRDTGDVSVLGIDPATRNRSWRTRIGIVVQESTEFQYSLLTVDELVRHFVKYYPDPRDPDEVVASVGLEEKRGARASELSGGQRRRLEVALSILGRPEVVFLDEPTTGFDPEARRQFWDLILSLKAGGTTVLLTTHYLDEAEHLADRVGVIAGGSLVAVDAPARLGGRQEAGVQVRYRENGEIATVHTDAPTKVIGELAARFGGEVPELTVTRPTLEDIYLKMIAKPDGESS
jgi:ABC-2 type transport system ATP-binding protein